MIGAHISVDRATVSLAGRDTLRDVTAAFSPGTVTALIGGDGAGKSTLLRLLAGRAALRGGTAEGVPVDRRNLGYQPADSGVWRQLSVMENLEFVIRAHRLPRETARSRTELLLPQAGLNGARHRLAGRLSGGMRQKLGVILATLHRPGLVLLDEPTTGVDPISRAELWRMITGAAADGATVVFSTTYVDEAARAQQVLLLADGELLASGTPSEVIDRTPGRLWQCPDLQQLPAEIIDSSRLWRRAGTHFLWTAPGEKPPLRGFSPAPGDLENSSIALLLDRGGPRAARMDFPPLEHQATRTVGSPPLLEATGVTRRYGTFSALHDVSMSVAAGEVVGLLGGNGAGKTTLMRILLGVESASAGSSSLFGGQPGRSSRRRLGSVAQGLGLYPGLSARENLDFSAGVHGTPLSDAAIRFARACGRAPVSSFSLGTQRLLAYLAALTHHPELLVLDEPTSGMDSLSRSRLWQDLRNRAEQGVGVLITTHYMQEAAQCDRLVILDAGRVCGAGTASEIRAAHRSLLVTIADWEASFLRLRDAGIPVLLDGRTLRVPGGDRDRVAKALASLAPRAAFSEEVATLEEAMLLMSLKSAVDGGA